MRHLVVIGAGITGLAAAFEHHRRHPGDQVTVLEAADRVGGKLHAIEFAGHRYDVGAEMVLAVVPEALDLIDAIGLTVDLVHPSTTSAAIVVNGRHHPIPTGTVLGVPASVEDLVGSELFSPVSLARIRAEPDAPGPAMTGDESVGGFLRPRLGDELVDLLIEPLLGGVYAGRADALSIRATMPALAQALEREPSVLRAAASIRRDPGAGPVFATLRGSLAAFAEALVDRCGAQVRLRTTVRAVRRTPAGYLIECGPASAARSIEADAVLIAVPPRNAARLLGPLAPDAADALAEIPQASMAILALGWASPQPSLPPGSGLLVPPSTGGLVKAVTISSNKWQHLSGQGVLVRASVGRTGEERALQRSDADLLAAAGQEVRELLGLQGAPTAGSVTRWGGGLPQYTVGHLDRIATVRAAVSQVPSLAVAGAAFDGVGVPACIRSAYAAVEALGD
ncbi:MAG: protoporphyrinogen oxidase [Actinomycetota bacterium]|nr:protoporphyrinogen oxidase [Actinomycetota bacterium]